MYDIKRLNILSVISDETTYVFNNEQMALEIRVCILRVSVLLKIFFLS